MSYSYSVQHWKTSDGGSYSSWVLPSYRAIDDNRDVP